MIAELTRLWRWLTAPQPTTCPTCGHRLSQHPDGGAGWVCLHCERMEK